jgi:hypothetical protein
MIAMSRTAAYLRRPSSLSERAVAVEVVLLEVVQQAAALTDEHEQTATRVMVLLVAAKVLGQVVDALGQERDLDAGVARVLLVFPNCLMMSSLRS